MPTNEQKYPIGNFEPPQEITEEVFREYIRRVKTFPRKLQEEVNRLSDSQLDTPYREGGWTLRQVIHHCADSHANAVTRIKLALTEEVPTIKPFDQERWAELPDSKHTPIEPALQMLTGIHRRWAALLEEMSQQQLQRSFIHPENGEGRIGELIAFFAWHGEHHLAHITSLKRAKGWK